MKKYMIMSLAMAACSVMVSGCVTDGRFVAQPHEGGEGYYSIVYDYDPASGEFVVAEGES